MTTIQKTQVIEVSPATFDEIELGLGEILREAGIHITRGPIEQMLLPQNIIEALHEVTQHRALTLQALSFARAVEIEVMRRVAPRPASPVRAT